MAKTVFPAQDRLQVALNLFLLFSECFNSRSIVVVLGVFKLFISELQIFFYLAKGSLARCVLRVLVVTIAKSLALIEKRGSRADDISGQGLHLDCWQFRRVRPQNRLNTCHPDRILHCESFLDS